MKNFVELFEELNKHQKQTVDYWKNLHSDKMEKSHSISDHVMNGEHTIYLPLQNKEDHNGEIPEDLHSHLKENGYSIPSFNEYRGGYATDKHGRMTSIGKALNKTKASEDLKTKFQNDPSRQTQHHDLHVAITKDPYHVAGMSTDRGWTSCMDMAHGCNSNKIENDLQHGTHAAYLIHKDDKDIKNPIARIALKPFRGDFGEPYSDLKIEAMDRVLMRFMHM